MTAPEPPTLKVLREILAELKNQRAEIAEIREILTSTTDDGTPLKALLPQAEFLASIGILNALICTTSSDLEATHASRHAICLGEVLVNQFSAYMAEINTDAHKLEKSLGLKIPHPE